MILAVILIAWILLSFVVLLMVAGAASKRKPVVKPAEGTFVAFEEELPQRQPHPQAPKREPREAAGGELATLDLRHPSLDVQH